MGSLLNPRSGREHAVVSAARSGSSDWSVIGTATGLAVLGYLPVFLVSSQAIRIDKDFPLGAGELGLVVGSFFLMATLATVLGGRLVERLPARAGRMLCGTLIGAGCAAICISDSWTDLLTVMIGLGIANSLCQAISNRGLAETVSAGRRGMGFGLKQAAVPVAVLLAGAGASVQGDSAGWRAAFVGGAVLSGVVVVVSGFSASEPRRRYAARRGARHQSGRGAMLTMTFANATASSGANAMAAFVPAWAFHQGLSVEQAGLLLVVASILNAGFRVFGGYRADRRGGRNLPVVAAQLLVGGAAVATFTFPSTLALVCAVLVAFAIGWSFPGLILYAVARLNPNSAARASTLVQSGGFAGGAIGPPAFGLVATHAGYEVAWWTTAAVFALAAALVLVARRLFIASRVVVAAAGQS